MSTPRYFRLAIESCRPCRPATLRLRPEFHARHFASKNAPDQQDVTQGSPVPPVAKSVAESPSEESQLLSDLPDAPPKRNPISVAKALSKTQQPASRTGIATTGDSKPSPLSRPPLNVLAAYHKPIKHRAEYGVPSCDLQLRSYSIRNLEFMGDFALRAAYYLKLPAVGPVPLPKRIERWTMPRSNFVNKKSQENFERITYKRLIQIKDGHRDAVEVWLSFLRRYQFYGVGMKANIWEYECLDVATKMDTQMHEIQKDLDEKLGMFGWNKQVAGKSSLADMMQKQGPRQVGVPLTMIREESQTRDNKQ